MDASLTLQALVECLPEAAALLLHPQHHGELLIVLAAIYSSTIPLLRRISQQPAAAAVPGLSPARIQRLQHCLECVVFHLLRSAFCTKQGALASGGPAAVAALAAAEGGPSGSSSSSSSSSRPRPPGFGSSSGPETGLANTGFNPEIQGQELMNLLMLLAHPSEVGSHAGPDAAANLLAAVNYAHHLDVAVSSAVSEVRQELCITACVQTCYCTGAAHAGQQRPVFDMVADRWPHMAESGWLCQCLWQSRTWDSNKLHPGVLLWAVIKREYRRQAE